MKQLVALLALSAALLAPADVSAQARGPEAGDIRESGQEILSRRERERLETEQEANMDEATRALRLGELDTWLRRLPGRYHIQGEVRLGGDSGSVDGVADCSGVGQGPGVDCIINAKWPRLGGSLLDPKPSLSEFLNTMRPSVLVFGMSLDPIRIVSQMVMGDSVVLDWSGKLQKDTLSQTAGHHCTDRCIGVFNVIAAAGSRRVTFEMLVFKPDYDKLDGVEGPIVVLNRAVGSITFRMERDPDARATRPLRALPSR